MADEEQVAELIRQLEGRIDAQEQLLANLMMAYMEVWVSIETIIHQMMETRTEEEQKKFLEHFKDFRTEMLKNMKEASISGVEGLDPELAETLERMVKGE